MVLLIGFALISVPAAHAATQNITCDGDTTDDATPSDSKKIADALDAILTAADPSNTLNITGSCSLTRPITIQSFPNILIQSPVGTANLNAPVTTCTSIPAPGVFAGTILNVIATRNITLRRLSISGGAGVLLQDSGGSFLGVSIDASRGEGLNVQGASTLGLVGGTLTGPTPGTFEPTPNNITNSCGNGINVGLGSSVSLTMLGTISGNGAAGVIVNGGVFSASGCCVGENVGSIVIENNRAGIMVGVSGGSASLNGGSTCAGLTGTAALRNNKEWGAIISGPSFFGLSGLVTVEGNQSAPTSSTALAYRAGIYGNYGATVFVTPGAQIKSTNAGIGILVDAQSKLRLGSLPLSPPPPGSTCTPPTYPNASITLNGDDGIKATHMSFIEILSATSVVNNSGKDARCDDSSRLDGIKSGIGSNKCQ